MKAAGCEFKLSGHPSEAARARMLATRWEPLFLAAWQRVLMVHFEVEAGLLQDDVPFPVDLWDGRAFVSLVMFTMRGMRPSRGGKMAAALFRPFATHDFLNLRTYVQMNARNYRPGFDQVWLGRPHAVENVERANPDRPAGAS
jgi:uncharacterized protein YqjF (DUF2071 family)